MPIPTATQPTARIRTYAVLERARDSVTTLGWELDGDAVAYTSGTYTLYGRDSNTVVYTVAIAGGSAASVTIPAASLPATLAYGQGYREEWLMLVGGVTTPYHRPAVLARRALRCPLTESDVQDVFPRVATLLVNAAPSLQSLINAAWLDCLQDLLSQGRWPETVVDPDSLIEFLRERTLFHLFRAASLAQFDKFDPLAQAAQANARIAWSKVRFRADADQDGIADSADRLSASRVVARAVSPPAYSPRHLYRRVL